MEQKTRKEIFEAKEMPKDFSQMVNGFEDKFKGFYKPSEAIPVKEYWKRGMGVKSALKKLNRKSDFKGLYVFLDEDHPFYVGISQRVIERINEHVKGKGPESATLAYNIGIIDYKYKNGGISFTGIRKNFPFDIYVKPIQEEFLMNSKVLFIPIDDDNELYLFEVFCSMKLKTYLNTFETH